MNPLPNDFSTEQTQTPLKSYEQIGHGGTNLAWFFDPFSKQIVYGDNHADIIRNLAKQHGIGAWSSMLSNWRGRLDFNKSLISATIEIKDTAKGQWHFSQKSPVEIISFVPEDPPQEIMSELTNKFMQTAPGIKILSGVDDTMVVKLAEDIRINWDMVSNMVKTASSHKLYDHEIPDTDRYTSDRYTISVGMTETVRGIEMGFHINSLQTGLSSFVEYWVFKDSEIKTANKAFEEIKEIIQKVSDKIQYERVPMSIVTPWFRIALRDVCVGNKERTWIPSINSERVEGDPEIDYRSTLYGNRYPMHDINAVQSIFPHITENQKLKSKGTGRNQVYTYDYAEAVQKTAQSGIQLNETESNIFEFIKNCIRDQQLQAQARVAGGWVRDKILGKQSKDLDITIQGMTGIQFADQLKAYASAIGQPQIIGTVKDTEARPEQVKNLAVAFTKIYGQEIEFLSMRGQEVYQEGDRNPISVNMQATPKDDALRRDLTINSLFYNINTGQVEDFTGKGMEDLGTMVLRTPLDPISTFRDDPLRLLRVLRFYSRYPNSQIAPEVIEAMKDESVQNQITRKILNPNEVSGIVPERTAIEFRKIMSGDQPDKSIRIMYETGLLNKILNLPPEFHPLNMDQQNKHHKLTVIDHTIQVLKNLNSLCKEYGLTDEERMKMNIASLFHDLGKLDPRSHKNKPDGSRGYAGDPTNPNAVTHQQSSGDVWMNFSKALKLSDDETKFIHEIVVSHMYPHGHIEDQGTASDKQLRKYIRKNPSWMFQYIHAMADALSKDQEEDAARADPYRANIERLRTLNPNPTMAPATDLLNGQEIIRLVGLPAKPPPGVQVGYIELVKERIREAQDENPALTKDQAAQIVKTMLDSGELNVYKLKTASNVSFDMLHMHGAIDQHGPNWSKIAQSLKRAGFQKDQIKSFNDAFLQIIRNSDDRCIIFQENK